MHIIWLLNGLENQLEESVIRFFATMNLHSEKYPVLVWL